MFIQLQTKQAYFSDCPQTLYCATFAVNEYNDNLFVEYRIHFPKRLHNAVIKRKAEYLAGRYLAKQALHELGFDHFELHSDHNRCPIWPKDVVGSISHTKNIVCCTVANSADVKNLGIDMEFWIKDNTQAAILNNIVDSTEQGIMNKAGIPFNKAFTLAFSAKESIFKALYPQVGKYFGFTAAKLIKIDPPQQRIYFKLYDNLSIDYPKETLLVLQYVIEDDFVLSLLSH